MTRESLIEAREFGGMTLAEIRERALRIEWEPQTEDSHWRNEWLIDLGRAVYALTEVVEGIPDAIAQAAVIGAKHARRGGPR